MISFGLDNTSTYYCPVKKYFPELSLPATIWPATIWPATTRSLFLGDSGFPELFLVIVIALVFKIPLFPPFGVSPEMMGAGNHYVK